MLAGEHTLQEQMMSLTEKKRLEEEAKESQGARNDLNLSAPGAEKSVSREVAAKIAGT